MSSEEDCHGTARRSPRRIVLVGIASWLLFGLGWWRVVELHATVSGLTVEALMGFAVLVLVVDVWWVGHNRRIYRRKGPRKGRPQVDATFVEDSLGRPLTISAKARRAAEVTVFLNEDGSKVYQSALRRA